MKTQNQINAIKSSLNLSEENFKELELFFKENENQLNENDFMEVLNKKFTWLETAYKIKELNYLKEMNESFNKVKSMVFNMFAFIIIFNVILIFVKIVTGL